MTPCLAVALQPCMEWIPIKKIIILIKHSKSSFLAVETTFKCLIIIYFSWSEEQVAYVLSSHDISFRSFWMLFTITTATETIYPAVVVQKLLLVWQTYSWVFRETATSSLILTYKLMILWKGFRRKALWFSHRTPLVLLWRGAGRELSCLAFPGNWVWLLLHTAPYYCVDHPLSFPIFMK